MRCKLRDATCALQSTWCNLCGASDVVHPAHGAATGGHEAKPQQTHPANGTAARGHQVGTRRNPTPADPFKHLSNLSKTP